MKLRKYIIFERLTIEGLQISYYQQFTIIGTCMLVYHSDRPSRMSGSFYWEFLLVLIKTKRCRMFYVVRNMNGTSKVFPNPKRPSRLYMYFKVPFGLQKQRIWAGADSTGFYLPPPPPPSHSRVIFDITNNKRLSRCI